MAIFYFAHSRSQIMPAITLLLLLLLLLLVLYLSIVCGIKAIFPSLIPNNARFVNVC